MSKKRERSKFDDIYKKVKKVVDEGKSGKAKS
jgi:hypothetical protein